MKPTSIEAASLTAMFTGRDQVEERGTREAETSDAVESLDLYQAGASCK